MKIYLRVLILMGIMLFVIPALAADDAADNACYEGGSMAGKCNLSTEAETEWAWTCGWYIARAERSAIAPDAVPSWCRYQYQTTTIDAPIDFSICYGSSMPSHADIQLTAPLSTVNNVKDFSSYDGTCTGSFIFLTYVDASDINDATNKCQALLMDVRYSGALPSSWGYSTPANWYYCQFL